MLKCPETRIFGTNIIVNLCKGQQHPKLSDYYIFLIHFPFSTLFRKEVDWQIIFLCQIDVVDVI